MLSVKETSRNADQPGESVFVENFDLEFPGFLQFRAGVFARQGRLRRVVSAAEFGRAKWPWTTLEAVGFEEVGSETICGWTGAWVLGH